MFEHIYLHGGLDINVHSYNVLDLLMDEPNLNIACCYSSCYFIVFFKTYSSWVHGDLNYYSINVFQTLTRTFFISGTSY